jgi:AcrR family transcriptional regulator
MRSCGRAARTPVAVMPAVINELTENGYANTTVARVAARAGIL